MNWKKKTKINNLLKIGDQFLFSRLTKNCFSFPNIFKSNIFKQQNRFISEGKHLMTLSDLLKLKGLLLTVNIEKPFDSVNHNFLLKVLKNYGFSHDFLKCVSILLQNQELCIINSGKTQPSKLGKMAGSKKLPSYMYYLMTVQQQTFQHVFFVVSIIKSHKQMLKCFSQMIFIDVTC